MAHETTPTAHGQDAPAARAAAFLAAISEPIPAAPAPRYALTPRELRELRERMDSAGERLAFQREVHALALRMGLEVEADRAAREIAEWEQELEDVIEDAAGAGYGPEDFEGGRA